LLDRVNTLYVNFRQKGPTKLPTGPHQTVPNRCPVRSGAFNPNSNPNTNPNLIPNPNAAFTLRAESARTMLVV